MILVTDLNDKTAVRIDGGTVETIAEFISLLKSIRTAYSERFSDSVADDIIALCGRVAFCNDDDIEDECLKRIADVLKEAESAKGDE